VSERIAAEAASVDGKGIPFEGIGGLTIELVLPGDGMRLGSLDLDTELEV
jgi:hypothetical protein